MSELLVTLTRTMSKLDNVQVVHITPNSDYVQVGHCPSCPENCMSSPPPTASKQIFSSDIVRLGQQVKGVALVSTAIVAN